MKRILLCLMFVLMLSGCGKDVNTNNEKVLEDKKDINITQKEDTGYLKHIQNLKLIHSF